ncbi:MAG: HU family DNA-binding protein [Thermodesulfobacteria bacterium]|nr:HU family DNA-binding protein [Thermodesulfobacteriota bacterium]
MSSGRKKVLEMMYERAGELYQSRRPSRFETKLALENILEILEEAFLRGEKVVISGFGVFEVKEVRPRKGFDFAKGEPKEIPSRRKVKFKPSSKLLKLLNP